jgi:dihydropteroate synthase
MAAERRSMSRAEPGSPPGPSTALDLRGRELDLGRPLVMGILNLTPDSFSDGGLIATPAAARERALTLVAEGADLLDLGAVSTRPGAAPVAPEEELRRLLPALAAVRAAVDLPLSVDTYRPEVAAAAADAGADCLNDVTALGPSDALARVAAAHDMGLVLMHMRGTPQTMQLDTRYGNLLDEVRDHLARAVERAAAAGVDRGRILVDPGIGFGKSVEGNLLLLARLDVFRALGQPILVGASRKSFIGKVLDVEVHDRLEGSLAAAVAAVLAGAHVIRTHDVRATVRAVRFAAAVRAAGRAGDEGPGSAA